MSIAEKPFVVSETPGSRRAALAEALRKAAETPTFAPLSSGQERLWFLDQLEPNVPLYNLTTAMRMHGPLQVHALEKALRIIVARHEVLRATFVASETGPIQMVNAGPDFNLATHDFSGQPSNTHEAALNSVIQAELNYPFKLSAGPLFRATLVRFGCEHHVLVLNMHHIVSDEWSLRALFRELTLLYSNESLPELPIQFVDYARWQQEHLHSTAAQSQLAFWSQHLEGVSGITELATDYPRPVESCFRGAHAFRSIRPELHQALNQLAERQAVTPFMLLFAAASVLIHRYSGLDDVVIGTPFAGRTRPEVQNLIGFFVNTLPLRTNFAANPSFLSLLASVRELTVNAATYQDLPLEKIVEALRPERSSSHMPFTRLMFVLQNQPQAELRLPGLNIESLEVNSEFAKFDLTLVLKVTQGSICACVEYNRDLFRPESIARFLKHYENLLASITADPEQRISELELLGNDERHQILVEWNQTATDYPRNKSIQELFEAQAQATPGAVALVFDGKALTYAELNARANQLARFLSRHIADSAVPVALCVNRSAEMVIAMLGIIKAGSPYLPLDPEYPQERLRIMIEDAGSTLLLTQQELLTRIPGISQTKVVSLDADWDLASVESTENPRCTTSPESLAYLMYTSGSTGIPKGVAVPHRAIVRLVRDTNYVRVDASDRIPQISNISFDAATFEVWGTLLNGATLVVITHDLALSAHDFAHELKEQRITVMFLTTALFNQLASEVPGAFENLRTIMAGGELHDVKWVSAVLNNRPPARFLNVYGPTENTTFTTYNEIAAVPAGVTNLPIGKPISNTQVYILDNYMNPVPIGVPGEIYTAGDGLALGYWNRPELTAEKFLSHPFPEIAASTHVYRTGDLARYLPDGKIEFLSRIDNQVKLRGFRIELGEIESVLAQHPQVRDCVVVLRGNNSRYKKLVGYCVSRDKHEPTTSTLRSFLEEKLPSYMVPSVFMWLPSLPLTPNGKIDREALPKPDAARPDLDKEYARPRDPVEAQLTAIWEEALGVRPIGVEDRFFELGGHSLLAVTVINRIEKVFGKKLRLATIFHAQTIEQLAQILRKNDEPQAKPESSIVEIQGRGSKPPLFLVHGVGGGMFWGYVNLSRYLGPDQPVYGFRAHGLDGTDDYLSVEEMAAQYVADLRKLQPIGPYNLGGYCLGGNIAYEMARQLEAAGEQVSVLALFNCAPPNSSYTTFSFSLLWGARFLKNLFYWGRYFRQWTPAQRKGFFKWKAATWRRRWARFGSSQTNGTATVNAGDLVDLSTFTPEQRQLWENHIQALVNYHPRPIRGKIHLFRSPGHPLWCSFSPDYGWRELASSVEVSIVHGTHEKILEEPCVSELAESLTSLLSNGDSLQPFAASGQGRMAVLKGMVVHASLFWLGAEGEVWQVDATTLEHGFGKLNNFLQHLGLLGLGVASTRVLQDSLVAPLERPTFQPLKAEDGRCIAKIQIGGQLAHDLGKLAAEAHGSLALVLVAAAKVLFLRYSPSENREILQPSAIPEPGKEDQVFTCAVNDLVIHTPIRGDESFFALLRSMVKATLEDLPELAHTGSLPLLKIHSTPDAGSTNSSVQLPPDLALEFRADDSEIWTVLQYNPQVMAESVAEAWLGHFQTLLGNLARDPNQIISELVYMADAERLAILSQLNSCGCDFPSNTSFITHFQAQVESHPEAVAVCFHGQSLTYAELNTRANRLAHQLLHRGIHKEQLVGVCLERSFELIVALLATWKAGGAYVPLDPTYPVERLQYMLADAKAQVLITSRKLGALFPQYSGNIIALDDPETLCALEQSPRNNIQLECTGEELAYVIYTSGSTGTPKGVEITQGSLLNHNFGIARAYDLAPADRVLQFTPISFDISVEEIFPTFLTGASLVLRTDEVLASVERFLDFVEEESITVLDLPTAYWHELVETLSKRKLPPAVRLVAIGGEKASQEAFKRWQTFTTGAVRLVNTYGPTETTVTATLYEPAPGATALPIGRPLPNVKVLVLDENMQPVPFRAVGELYIGGKGVGRGYLNRPDLTLEKFVPNPFPTEVPCQRLYRTGDLVRYTEDGNLEFVGRADQQVKVRGFRIELGEIEAALRELPAVKEAVVAAREDRPGQKRLVAYLVPRDSAKMSPRQIRANLRRRLPDYMVPTTYVNLSSLPLTPAGKLDRRALPKPGTERPDLTEEFVAPRNPLESALAAIWGELLGVSQVGVLDNFFDLGGHSLIATQVMSRIKEHLQADLSLASLFEMPTIEALANHLAENTEAATHAGLNLSGAFRLPLTPTQERIWVLDEFEPQTSAYSVVCGFKLKGELNLEAFEKAVQELASRHDVLRAVFPADNGHPVQYITAYSAPDVHRVDVSDRPAQEREAEALLQLRKFARRNNIKGAPLLSACLVRLSGMDHLLLFRLHEIAVDSESAEILAREFASIYGTFAEGRGASLPPLSRSYRHSVQCLIRLANAKKEEQLQYWRNKLAGVPAVLDFPADFPRPAHRGDSGERLTLEIPRELAEKARRLASKEGVALPDVFLAVLQALVHRYTGSSDFVIGTSVSVRPAEFSGVMGQFHNTIAIRSCPEATASFRQLLVQTHHSATEARQNAQIPFGRVLEELNIRRSASSTPLFQVFFRAQSGKSQAFEAGNLLMHTFDLSNGTSKYDLSFSLMEETDIVLLHVDFSTDLFLPERVLRLREHFQVMLSSAVEHPDNSLAALNILEQQEKDRLLQFSGVPSNAHETETLWSLFEEQVGRNATTEALVTPEARLTYSELHQRASVVAATLGNLGLQPGFRVAVCLDRNWEMVAAILGILKAGGAYVPLDPAYPAERLRYILADAQVAATIAQRQLASSIPELEGHTIWADELNWEENSSVWSSQTSPGPKDVAYVIYTSGSTGTPKGVSLQHCNAVALVRWAPSVFSPEELGGVLASTSICFDLSIFELFVPLCTGGRVILAANAIALDRLPARHEVTLVNTVPSAVRELLNARALPDNVKVVNLAGEPLATSLVDRIYSETRVEKVYDLYGPTETTTYSTFGLRRPGQTATIGSPISGEEVLLLDAHHQLVPIGVPGEIYIGGAGVAQGYLNRPELTQERFLPHPFRTGYRVYRTGDLGRWHHDGTLEYLGRLDNQVKIRGFRIELGEIEEALKKYPGIQDAAVVAREDRNGDRRLVAFLCGDTKVESHVRQYLQHKLPDYMVPAFFVVLPELPLTPTGKIDRKQLPNGLPDAAPRCDHVPPQTILERQLADLWTEVLEIDNPGINDNFFEVGGHSLLAIRLLSRLRQRFNMDLPLFVLFEAPTIADLARGLESGRWTNGKVLVPSITAVLRGNSIPVSFVQERLWFLDQLQPGSDAYNVPWAVWLHGWLDRQALEKAWYTLVKRHEALRTLIQNTEENLCQVIAEPQAVPFQFIDFSHRPETERNSAIESQLISEARRAFDLHNGPLARITLLRSSDEEHALGIVLHHSISDGWSLGILMRELALLYDAFASGLDEPQLPTLPVQYADYSVWLRDHMQGTLLEQELEFWRSKLKGAPQSIALPSDSLPDSQVTPKAGRITSAIPEDVLNRLQNRFLPEGTTPFMVLTTALAITLYRWSKQSDMVIGTVVAGRSRQELENLVGCFMNFLPIRTQVKEKDSAQDVLARTRSAILEAQSHQDCPFERLVEAINPERKLNSNPLYNVALLLQNYPEELFDSELLVASPIPCPMDDPLLDLRFEAVQSQNALEITCEYRSDLFTPATVTELMDSLLQVLHALTENPAAPLATFSITSGLTAQATHAGKNRQKLAISATFTAEPLEVPLRWWMRELQVPADVEFAPYNQVFHQLLDAGGLFARNGNGMNVLLVRVEDWAVSPNSDWNGETEEKLRRSAQDFVDALKSAGSNSPFLVCLCPPSTIVQADAMRRASIESVEAEIQARLANIPGIYFLSREQLSAWYPVESPNDPAADELGHVPYVPLYYTALATGIARKFHSLKRSQYKVIVLDCDHTLWSGVCGEDGARGIVMEEPRRRLQEFMVQQHQAGMLLCTCSKNNEEDVREVFETRQDMPLTSEHFVATRLNWLPKSENLKSLARELNLGLDAFIFIDDNPVECAEVEANCPDVLTLQLPEDPQLIPQFLEHCWAFDRFQVTEEDRKRSEMYHQNAERERLRSQSLSLGDFLAGLDLKIEIQPMLPAQVARVAQLTQKTNQFNCSTRRRSEAEILQLMKTAEILTVHVEDRFGDYGLVGVIICSVQNGGLGVDTFLLSCRVLGRGVEHRMLARLGELAREQRAAWVDIHFVPSAKNRPALNFLETVGGPFKQTANRGVLFRFPAAVAESTSLMVERETPMFMPEKQASGLAGQAQTLAPSSAPVFRFNNCRAIALQSRDISSLHEKLETQITAPRKLHTRHVPPRNEIERQLCRIWESLLRVEKVGIQDNFFELGGHSLLAVRLFSQIEKVTGSKFPLVTLFQAPTIEQLAKLLSKDKSSNNTSLLVPIQPSGSRPPLFLVHGAGGDVLWGYANLAGYMGEDQPIYGIKSRGQVGLDELNSIEEMAACYVEEIRAFQPQGPYLLGGYCFGGNVAYEMARQLRSQGEEVAVVALLDTAPSNAGYEKVTWWQPLYAYRFLKNLSYWFDDFRKLKPAERRNFVTRKVRALYRKLRTKVLRDGSGEVDLDEVINVNHFPEHELLLWQIHLDALVSHTEKPYSGKVLLLRTRGQPLFCSLQEDFCWNQLVVGGVEIRLIPGSHEQVFVEPHVQSLAANLKESIDQALSTPTQTTVCFQVH